ncbi:hypothetical protein EYF80_004014 [Liparis tanakae]|uniref:Uncharacterized protein n=1 Tax=Liparis tanakae TaxID=230148 RepID=A0A4Z2J6W3_9TELE|nr:hypothetical protein EYF80_004014 [Liparis tanakae]
MCCCVMSQGRCASSLLRVCRLWSLVGACWKPLSQLSSPPASRKPALCCCTSELMLITQGTGRGRVRPAYVRISTVPILPVRFAAARSLSPEPPAADTTGTAEADLGRTAPVRSQTRQDPLTELLQGRCSLLFVPAAQPREAFDSQADVGLGLVPVSTGHVRIGASTRLLRANLTVNVSRTQPLGFLTAESRNVRVSANCSGFCSTNHWSRLPLPHRSDPRYRTREDRKLASLLSSSV